MIHHTSEPEETTKPGEVGRGTGLILVGYRGTGKTTVGRIVAGRLGCPFFDADVELEARAGRTIRQIFADDGEPTFRDLEESTLATLTAQPGSAVLATGGGAVLRESNRRRLRKFGPVVWLRAEPSELARRLLADPEALEGRPALTTAGTLEEIVRVLEARLPLYREVCDIEVETGGLNPSEVAEIILTRARIGTQPGGSHSC
jgi:shikimate kinase